MSPIIKWNVDDDHFECTKAQKILPLYGICVMSTSNRLSPARNKQASPCYYNN